MKYGYTVVYVSSVEETMAFYQAAFGFKVQFVHESKQYGELATGSTILAFASHEFGEMNLDGEYLRSDPKTKPFGVEMAFVTDDVATAYAQAVSVGAIPIKPPADKPWGQTVAYVRGIDGSLIELCTPVTG